MATDPLTGEELEDDELNYRNQLRDAFANGIMTGQPNDDGSWNVAVAQPAQPDVNQPPPDINQPDLNQPQPDVNQPQQPRQPMSPDEIAQYAQSEALNTNPGTGQQGAATREPMTPDQIRNYGSQDVGLGGAPSLTPQTQDMNTPGVTAPNTLRGRLQEQRFNPEDPTAGNVAPDAAQKLIEATAVAVPSVALASDPALYTNGLTKWVADMAIRTGVGSRVADVASDLDLPGPANDVLGILPYTVGSSGLLGAIEKAGVMGTAMWGASKSGIPEGPSVPIVGNARDAAVLILSGALLGKFEDTVKASDEAVASGKPNPAAGIDEDTAARLRASHEAVTTAAPDDMVTVYKSVSRADAENIAQNNLQPGESVTADPEHAALKGFNEGQVDPTIVSFTVPRGSLDVEGQGAFGTLKAGEELPANDPYIPNATEVVTNWLQTEPTTLYHWTPDRNVNSIMQTGLRAGSWLAETPEKAIDQARIQNRISRAVGAGEITPGTVLAFSVDEGQVRDARTHLTMSKAFRANEPIFPDLSHNELNASLDTARMEAAGAANKLADLQSTIDQGSATSETIRDYQDTREKMLRSLSDTLAFGADLAGRTDGQQGLGASMRAAIKQLITSEEGSIKLPALHEDGTYEVHEVNTPKTDQLTGWQPVVPHLTPAEQLMNNVKEVTNRGIFADPLARSILNQRDASIEVGRSRAAMVKNRVISELKNSGFKVNKDGTVNIDISAKAVAEAPEQAANYMHPGVPAVGGDITAVTKATINGETRYKIVKSDGSISYFKPNMPEKLPSGGKAGPLSAVDLQDIAADYNNYKPFLTPKQQAFMEFTRNLFKPEQDAMLEIPDFNAPKVGGDIAKVEKVTVDGKVQWEVTKTNGDIKHIDPKDLIGTRPDVQPGGWYLPRGDASSEGWARDAHLQLPKSRRVKIGAEQTAEFKTMAEGRAAGYQYLPFQDVAQKFVQQVNGRLTDAKIVNVLKNSTDENGRPLADTPAGLAARDPANAALYKRVNTLRGQVASLEKSLGGLDDRTRAILLKFVHTPALDSTAWDEARNALDAMSTSGGKLRTRPTMAPGDIQTNFRTLRREITQRMTVTRGQYKSMNMADARRLATEQTIKDLKISRGRFAGMDATQGAQLLDSIKKELNTVTPAWKDAVESATRDYTRMDASGFGVAMQNYYLPDRVASDLNTYLKTNARSAGKLAPYTDAAVAGNNLLRSLRLAGDFATMSTHGTIGLFNNPVAYSRALVAMFKSTADKSALGDYIRDFDAKRATDGRPTTDEWIQAGAHIGDAGTGIAGLNRAYGTITSSLRLELNHAGYDPAWDSLPDSVRMDKMREVASTNNLITGYAPKGFGGALGQNLLLAPRLIQSQLDLLARSLNPKGGLAGIGDARRKLLTYFGVATALTVAANEFGPGAPNGFDYLNPRINGQWNPNFMKINIGGQVGKVSLFGAYDWMLKAAEAGTKGDFTYLPRTKAGPLASAIWDLASGHDFLGHPLDIKDPRSLVPWLVSTTTPIAFSEPASALARGQLGTGPTLSIGAAAEQLAFSETGIKHSAPTASAEFGALRDTTLKNLVDSGDIPPNIATSIQGMAFQELPSGIQKQVDQAIKLQDPDNYKWYHQQRLDQGSVYEQRTAAADVVREHYNSQINDLVGQLKNGADPYMVWNAYDNFKKEMTGALWDVYNGKDGQEYQAAIAQLRPSDMRKIETAYDNITFNRGKPIETYTSDDWNKIAAEQETFKQRLANIDPDKAAIFNYNLQQKDKLNLENSNTLERLKKTAQAQLQPYFDLLDAEKNGTADKGSSTQWLADNPKQDYMHWLTTKPLVEGGNPTLHSVDAAEQALGVFGATKREIRLAGTTQPVDRENLTVFKQYDNEITQLFSTPTSAQVGNRTTDPRTELRRRDPLYDALYYWMGMNTPSSVDDKRTNTVVVYHPEAVAAYVAQWGERKDGVGMRRVGSR